MKKFYMILAALLIGSVCFAQKNFSVSERYTSTTPVTAERSGWIGNQSGTNVLGITAGHAVIMRGEQFSGYSAGNTITKVKFSTCNPQDISGTGATTYASYTNNSFTVKFYEGATYSDDFLTDGAIAYTDGCYGNQVYSQAYTQTAYGDNEVVLTTPYTINANNFWIVVECAGNTVFLEAITTVGNEIAPADFQTQADPSVASQNYLYSETYTPEGGSATEIVNNNCMFYWNNTQTAIQPYSAEIRLSFYVEDGGAYVENSDISAGFLDTYPNPTADINALTLAANQDLTIYPYIQNNGPDAIPTTETVNVTFTVAGQDLYGQAIPMQWENPLPSGYYSPVQISEADGITFTAEELDGAGLPAEFDICITATYTGVDNNSNNNTACLHVTRQIVSVDENVAEAVSVYPNPANDMFTVANAEGATIVVVNSLGQVVATIENAASNQTIDASEFANGTYFVKVNEEVVRINVVK